MVSISGNNKWIQHLVDYARERNIEIVYYNTELCKDPKNPSVNGAHRIVTVNIIFSETQMIAIDKNRQLLIDIPKLSEEARVHAVSNKGYPNTAEFHVYGVEKIDKNKFKIVGSSVCVITATVDVLLQMK